MNKADFFKKNDEKFLPLGFEKDETDPMFFYVKSLVSEEAVKFSESIVSKWLITLKHCRQLWLDWRNVSIKHQN